MSMELHGEWDITTVRDNSSAGRHGGLERRQRPEGALGGFRFGARLSDTGDVYEGHHLLFPDDPFVIKLLGHLTEDRSEAVAAFSREANLMSTLHHPNIVQVLAAGVLDSRTPFVAMERLRGRTLEEHLNLRYPLPLSLLLPVLREIVSALSVAHANGVVHREIRPDNVFLVNPTNSNVEAVKLLDFGVSRLTENEGAVHRGISADDSRYLAPEQRAGSSADISSRADQFALAALVCRILRGATPLPCNPVVRQSDRETHPASPSTTPTLRRSSEVKAVLFKALSESPGDRYRSVAKFLTSLERALLLSKSILHHRAPEERESGRYTTWIGRGVQEGIPIQTPAMALPSFDRAPGRHPSRAVVAMIAACVVGSVAAWGIGLGVLRPPVTAQLAAPMAASGPRAAPDHLGPLVSPASKR